MGGGGDGFGRAEAGLQAAMKGAEGGVTVVEESAARTTSLAAGLGLRLLGTDGQACDRTALRNLLEETTVAKVLSHGFVDPQEQVVALMIANDGALPLANSVAAATDVGRAHRFDWRECQSLRSAPRMLFSAACSTGRAHLVGLGDASDFSVRFAAKEPGPWSGRDGTSPPISCYPSWTMRWRAGCGTRSASARRSMPRASKRAGNGPARLPGH